MPETISGYIELEQGRLYFESAGSGQALLFLHDGLLDCRCWDAQFDHFSRQGRVLRYDRRGYGNSDASEREYSNVEDLKTVLDFLQVEKAAVIGGSGGGMVALDFALAYPNRVDRLILIGPAVSGFEFSASMLQRLEYAFKPLVEDDDIEGTIANWASDPQLIHPGNAAARQRFRQILSSSPHNFYAPPIRPAADQGSPAINRLHEVKAPTTIVVGEADHPDNHAAAGALQAGIKNAERVVLSNAAHLPYIEQPDRFNRLLEQRLGC
ncbi:MAG: alpha/beta hydrolase [Anaerolineales bacterium]|nr:alpha/beta hydrolase [Anaerolineales bacterium]